MRFEALTHAQMRARRMVGWDVSALRAATEATTWMRWRQADRIPCQAAASHQQRVAAAVVALIAAAAAVVAAVVVIIAIIIIARTNRQLHASNFSGTRAAQ